MDPTETLRQLIEAAIDRDAVAFRDLAKDLELWLSKGGFAPDLDDVVRKLADNGY